ncbi:hypothetical protein PUG46_19355 [Erwiniaceae bacterium L1_55_4]|nr:hypothetical protein [Erwiniaceae bacterium L1_55_4]MDF7631412.1 hypothetical protein [Erwiniaceae bacterium L1_55_4]
MGIPNYYKRQPTNKNRRQTLKDRLNRLIDNSSVPSSEKVFLKQNILPILQEYAELWACRNDGVDQL